MTTWAGMGTNGNAGPVARLQAELEAVEGELTLSESRRSDAEGELVLARAEIAQLTISRNYYRVRAGEAEAGLRVMLSERDEARALVSDTLVCW